MEHDDRPPVATFFHDAPFADGDTVTLDEAAAHHARVKRLELGDAVRLTNGVGRRGVGMIAALRRGALDVAIERTSAAAPQAPIHLRVAIGDRDRMLWLAEKATELGVSSWQAVRFRRSMSVSPRGEGQAFAAKVRARMIGALEQSGGAWLPSMLPEIDVDALTVEDGSSAVLLDVSGAPIITTQRGGAAPIILCGPEGGIEESELARLIASGWQRARLGETTLRFETAALSAAAVFRALHEGTTRDDSRLT